MHRSFELQAFGMKNHPQTQEELTMTTLYTAHVHVTGGRDGAAKSSDGKLDLKLAPPAELGGNGAGSNPEQLFAAGYAACFMGAARLVAGNEKIALPQGFAIDADVALGKDAQDHFRLGVVFNIALPGMDKAAAEALVAKAHEVCPYSRATRGNIDVTFHINV
jgi:peroxiredoxin, ohr subfamily